MTGCHFLALISPDASDRRRRAASIALRTGYVAALDGRMLTVLVAEDCARLVNEEEGALLLGFLRCSAGDTMRLDDLDPTVCNALRAEPPQSFLDHYWGQYLAFVADGPRVHILRDPSGGIPCYWTVHDRITVLASCHGLLVESGLLEPQIDWNFMASHLHRGGHHSHLTAIAGLQELLPGFKVTWARDAMTVGIAWDPYSFAARSQEVSALDAARLLESTIDTAVSTYRQGSTNLLVTVSGGLDSSIVTASLAQTGVTLTGLTIAAQDPEGDERGFARLLFADRGGTLVERFYHLEDIDPWISNAAHLPRPNGRTFAQGSDRLRQDIALSHGASAIFTGDGGDAVFCLLQSTTPLLDRLMDQGLSRGLLHTLADISLMSGCSYPVIFRHALSKACAGRRYRWKTVESFLTPEAIELAQGVPWHPWLDAPRGARPGTAAHIALLVRAQPSPDAYVAGTVPSVMPLMAQPVLETCLSIPTWLWCRGGENRAMARLAFEHRLPPRIAHRRTKGGPDSFCQAIVDHFRSRFVPFLTGGMLADKGLLDRDAVSFCLGGVQPLAAADYHRILALVDAEVWARGVTAALPHHRPDAV